MTRARGWSLWSLRMCIIFYVSLSIHTHTHIFCSERKYFVYKLSKKKTNERKDTQKKTRTCWYERKIKMRNSPTNFNLKSEINRILSSATACVCVRLCKEHNIYQFTALTHSCVFKLPPCARTLNRVWPPGRASAKQVLRSAFIYDDVFFSSTSGNAAGAIPSSVYYVLNIGRNYARVLVIPAPMRAVRLTTLTP